MKKNNTKVDADHRPKNSIAYGDITHERKLPKCRATFFIRCKKILTKYNIYTKIKQIMQMIITHVTTRKEKDNVQKKRP